MKFLVIDDHRAAREMVRRIITSRKDWEIIGEARNGREALDGDPQNADVILLDIFMPIMDGLETLPHLKIRAPRTRVILMTATPNPTIARRGLQAGADGFIAKEELTPEALLALLA